MLEKLKRLFGKAPPPHNITFSTAQSERIVSLMVDAIELQLTMAEVGEPSQWTAKTRSTVLGYIAAVGEAMTNDPGGPKAMLVCVQSAQKVLRNTFNPELILNDFEDLNVARDTYYGAGATAGYTDTPRLQQKRPLIGLLAALQ
ncbi:hypothetical protein [Variovorax sp. RO1]|uniref:hypothetical protein n=1 Tax=Variovorax sp. RO1 TaxID=2066034 RepID=UPI00117BE91F|nr:hypothetical protein [Variovorax sp. RO1]